MSACSWGRCKSKNARVIVDTDERYCGKHATWVADKLVGDWVKRRDVRCMRCGNPYDLQWAHILTRSKRAIRYLTEPFPGNSVTLDRGCHYAYTMNPGNWDRWLDGRWPGHRDRLNRMQAEAERSGEKVNMAGVILRYRSEP